MRYILVAVLMFGCSSEAEYADSVPHDCRPERGSLVIDKFSKDTLIVESLWISSKVNYDYTGDITVRAKNHREFKLECGEYKMIENETD